MRALLLALVLALLPVASARGADGRVVDMVLAEVDGRLTTLSDVALARALGLFGLDPSDGPITSAEVERYLDAQLTLAEATQLGIEVEADAAARAWEAAGGDDLRARLEASGLGVAQARRLIEGDLRMARFLELRFRAFAFVTDADVEQALGSGPSDAATREAARERLRMEGATRAFTTWLQDARRHAPLRYVATGGGPWPAPFSLRATERR
jgi:hypothetical protein